MENEEKYDEKVSELVAEIIVNLIREADRLECNRIKLCKDVTTTLVGFAMHLSIDDDLEIPGGKKLN